ncbi:lipase secretion chaperone [Ideonella dechloratans]|uniref:lipase secretion chaperone n=1 Tax=Ideonella dechloratans TaxID=36863 RepID=UPI0035B28ACC
MPVRRTTLWAGATLLLCGGLWWAWAAQAPGARAAVRLSPAAAQDATTVGARPAPPNAVDALQPDPTRSQRGVAQVRQALFERGSLRGVQPDGGFRLDAQGRLIPDRAVRRRFDQLLSTLGEATIEELGALLQQQARAELGSDDGAAQVMAVWERYLQLQRQLAPAGSTGSAPTADSLALALQERARQRRLVLGNDWAEAFYGDEEAALQARLSNTPSQASTGEQAGTALPAAAHAPQPGEDLTALQRQREATLGPEAAARLQALDQAQAAWAENIQATRRALTRLQGATELSALQRQQAIDQLIESRFAPEDRLRARAVLGLISP